jgi:hypothetical protein
VGLGFRSGCHHNTNAGATASTALIEEFKLFDSIDVFFNNVLYISVGFNGAGATAQKDVFGLDTDKTHRIIKFFLGTHSDFPVSTPIDFEDFSAAWSGESTKLSTVKVGSFRAKFLEDYSDSTKYLALV